MRNPEFCPNCGERIRENDSSCRNCGSCTETGWSERAYYDSIGVDYDADEQFDYDEFLEREFNTSSSSGQGQSTLFRIVAAVLVILLVYTFVVIF